MPTDRATSSSLSSSFALTSGVRNRTLLPLSLPQILESAKMDPGVALVGFSNSIEWLTSHDSSFSSVSSTVWRRVDSKPAALLDSVCSASKMPLPLVLEYDAGVPLWMRALSKVFSFSSACCWSSMLPSRFFISSIAFSYSASRRLNWSCICRRMPAMPVASFWFVAKS